MTQFAKILSKQVVILPLTEFEVLLNENAKPRR